MSTAKLEEQRGEPGESLTLGLRLRNARLERGLSVAEVAEQLRLKTATVEALEREDMDLLGAPVYVRGYFTSYANLVKVPLVLVEDMFARHVAPAPRLHTTAHVSHSRYLFDRYARRMVYVVLTASIVVPVILLATRDQLPRPGAILTSLDAPVSSDVEDRALPEPQVSRPGLDQGQTAVMGPAHGASGRSAAENPVMASITPFYSPATPIRPGTEPGSVAGPAAARDNRLSLHFSGDSWVEVLGDDGEKLEFGVLRAGESRDFDLSKVRKVSLGNAAAVEVRMNGAVTDVSPFRRANVARFTVSSQGKLAAAGG